MRSTRASPLRLAGRRTFTFVPPDESWAVWLALIASAVGEDALPEGGPLRAHRLPRLVMSIKSEYGGQEQKSRMLGCGGGV